MGTFASARLSHSVLAFVLLAPVAAASGVRPCRYVPGVSVPAVMPSGVADRIKPRSVPTSRPSSATKVSAETTALQLRVLEGLANAVRDNYVFADFRGHDWTAMTAAARSLIQRGISDADFYAAMAALIMELGDGHSYFQSPAVVKDGEAAIASQYNFAGVGALFVPIAGTEHAAIMSVFAGSPAAEAGMQPHDIVLHVDGGPLRDASGKSRTLGVVGSNVNLTVRRPGQPPRLVTLTRGQVTGILPIDYCVVPSARIGYIFLPTLLDKTMDGQVRDALRKMTADGPLRGLILDNRMNGGGLGSVTQSILGLFTRGVHGHYLSRSERQPLNVKPEDIGGSQMVPLVVLAGADTVSYGEIMSGVLRLSGRARIVGGRTAGNVERLRAFKFADGSRAWIATDTFQPLGMANGVWEDAGVVPDVSLPTRWDLFTEANDPALAKAVELLKQ
jgi:carboxyl-terminal processing protease